MPKYSSHVEDYLKNILELEEAEGRARTGDIAGKLGVTAPSVTEMLRKLEKAGFLKHKKYGGARLTKAGRAVAEAVRKRQNTLKRFFNLLELPEKRVAEESCKLEHQLSEDTIRKLERFLDRIENKLGKPSRA